MEQERKRTTGHETAQRRPVPGTYYLTALALMILLALTAFAGLQDLGAWTPVVAIGIAIAKAALILLVFMHLKFSDRILWVVAGGGLLWLCILFTLTLSDYFARGSVGIPGK